MPLDKGTPSFTLPKLPYPENALEPAISAKTVSFHYAKHHAGYVKKLNELVAGTPYAAASLEDVILKSAKDAKAKSIFHNAAQAWNHDFYWHSMSPNPTQPSGKLRAAIDDAFGGLPQFKDSFSHIAGEHFGSGWAWLVLAEDDKLGIVTTANADTPIVRGQTPLLAMDIWEHAYYLDYQNRRPDHIAAWLDKLVNWPFAEQNFA